MPRMPTAVWIGPTVNEGVGGMTRPLRGLVLHIQQGHEQGTEAWFRNPAAQASSHFLNPKVGPLRQLVDTNDKAWAESDGNPRWISVENEGFTGESLTDSQIENLAELTLWLHVSEAIPLQSTDDPNGSGLGWHGMGAAAWGGHVNCPGNPIVAQRGAILARATELAQGFDVPLNATDISEINQVVIGVVRSQEFSNIVAGIVAGQLEKLPAATGGVDPNLVAAAVLKQASAKLSA